VRKIAVLLFASLLFCLAPLSRADVAAIHADRLPQEVTVLAALDDARELEPYSHSWTQPWRFPVAKEETATRLGKDLGFLAIALKSHPDNAELLLLTGLVASYAYNLDVDGSHEAALSALERARKLAPSDVRAQWFHATALCQTAQPKDGADEFLSIESSHAWEQLPAGYWNDFIECAAVTNIPAHLLRAVDHIEKLHAPPSEIRAVATEATRKRYEVFDPKKHYEPKELWHAEKIGENSEFTSTTCGVRLRTHGNWEINNLGLNGRGCVANFSTGPYKATTRDLSPSILVLVKQADENETLLDFAKKYARGLFGMFKPSRCPASECIALWGVQSGMYKKDGDGRGRIVVFERDQPEFPGLIFETPEGPPLSNGQESAQVFHPNQLQQRIPGKLYYLVLLDTASSIEEPAMEDFGFFLENLTVE
jgi:hypothetical protein